MFLQQESKALLFSSQSQHNLCLSFDCKHFLTFYSHTHTGWLKTCCGLKSENWGEHKAKKKFYAHFGIRM